MVAASNEKSLKSTDEERKSRRDAVVDYLTLLSQNLSDKARKEIK
jgi:uncharacterized protein YqeY